MSGTSSPSVDGNDTAAGIEHTHVMRERRGRQLDVDAGERPRRGRGAGLHHHFEPEAEAIGVELLVQPGLRGAPQIEIEHLRQLAWCRERHELAARLEPAILNDAVQHLGWQSGHDVREVRRVQNAIEQITRVPPEHGRAALRSRAPPDEGDEPVWAWGPVTLATKHRHKQSC